MQSRRTVNSGYLTLYISESYPCCLLDAVRIRGPDNVVELAQHSPLKLPCAHPHSNETSVVLTR